MNCSPSPSRPRHPERNVATGIFAWPGLLGFVETHGGSIRLTFESNFPGRTCPRCDCRINFCGPIGTSFAPEFLWAAGEEVLRMARSRPMCDKHPNLQMVPLQFADAGRKSLWTRLRSSGLRPLSRPARLLQCTAGRRRVRDQVEPPGRCSRGDLAGHPGPSAVGRLTP